MYDPVNTKSGVTLVSDWVKQFTVQQGADGLTMSSPSGPQSMTEGMTMPGRLRDWLVGVRLLRHIPLAYLVPDARLLPAESIRFFQVDYTWLDRVIDGVLSTANTGTVDATFTYGFLQKIRDILDQDLIDKAKASVPASTWSPGPNPMTGCLIRSELVRRWPNMIVQAFSDKDATKEIAVLRAEPISSAIYIALFAGQPVRVDIREPFVGVRFGVEGTLPDDIKVDKRNSDGNMGSGNVTVTLRNKNARVLDVNDLSKKVGSSRMVALNLEQRPYVQIFNSGTKEERGSVSPIQLIVQLGGQKVMTTGRGRKIGLGKFEARFNESQQLESK